ncbi:MAG: site-specific integrase [Lachnospiraceae bacterium]|nr:site-specific integrase [Lachnospiraceae bacterium]
MARKRENGTRATGIVARNGILYIVLPTKKIENGKTVYGRQWINTGLENTENNVKLAIAMRKAKLETATAPTIINYCTFEEYVTKWLDDKRREIADTTYSAYKYGCSHIIHFLGAYKLREISRTHIQEFYDYLLMDGKRHKRTLKDIKRLLNRILEDAEAEKLIAANPCKYATVNKVLLDKYAEAVTESDTFFSYSEAQLFLTLADEEYHSIPDSNDYFELFYVALFFALRREEVLGLQWSAIDLEKKSLTICATVTKGTEINYLNTTKTESSKREYPLTEEQVKLFQYLKHREEKMKVTFGSEYHINDYVFKNADGSLYYPDSISRVFSKFIKRHSILPQNVTLHKLRRSCVSILIHMGFDVKSIQKWVGHKSMDTTLKWYGAAKDKEAKQEISEGLKDIYIPKNISTNNISN